MVKVPGINRLRKLNRVAGAIDVDGNLAFFVGAQVIDGGQMIKMADLALEFFDVVAADAELSTRPR